MRKSLIALGLAVTTGLGATPIAGALAASPLSSRESSVTPHSVPSRANSVSGGEVVQTALQYVGYPYTTVGNSPQTGFSCIGLVSYVYRSLGIPLPGDLGGAFGYAPQVPFSSLLPGDILYFQNTVWAGLSHTGIYMGGGRFVHAEWYNRGVRVSTFKNDPVDFNYWTDHYLGANRPWAGVSVAAPVNTPVNTPPAAPLPPNQPAAAPQKLSGIGTTTVTVPSLNVRTAPSKNASVRQIIARGASVTILRKRNGWYKVQLPDGSIGWVVAIGTAAQAAPAIAQKVANSTVGTTVAPPRAGAVTARRPRAMTAVRVSGLRVHTSPSIDAPVVTMVGQGQKIQVLGRNNGWLKVRMSNGTTGWVVASMTSGAHTQRIAAPSTPPAYRQVSVRRHVTARRTFSRANAGTSRLTAGVRLHVKPGLRSSVLGVVGAGTHIRVLGYNRGWVLVRLPSGQTGYVYGIYVHR